MKEIYLVRHGEAIDDIEGLYGGAADHPPTEKSLKEAEEFAEQFKDKEIEVIVTSPYLRAKVPAEVVAKKLNLPLETEFDIRERNTYGIMTGMKKIEAAEKYPDLVEAVKKPASQVEGAELNSLFRKRVVDAVERIWARPEQKIMIFTHMGAMLATPNLHYLDMEAEHFG